MISCTRVSGLRLDAEEPQTRAAGEGRMSRSTGGMGNIYRYACIIDPGQQEKEGCPAPRGGGGKRVEGRMSR